MSSSKTKGDNYERELAKYFTRETGIQTERTPLSGGGFDIEQMADLYGPPHIWIEAKRVEKLNVLDAIKQAERGIERSGSPDVPVVINRRNLMTTGDSLVTMRLDAFIDFYKAFLKQHGYTHI